MRQPHLLERAEYVEQAYLFELLRERTAEQMPMQDLLAEIRFELLTTTNLPIAVEYLLTELKHSGQMSPAMFSAFSTIARASRSVSCSSAIAAACA